MKLWRARQGAFVAEGPPGEEQEDEREAKPPPLPARPWKVNAITKLTFEESKCGDRTRKKIPVPNVPDKLESPGNAPRFGARSLGGYFPWVGKHPEDVLSESNIKLGYHDKPPNPQEKEFASGKSSLYITLKHRSGLATLSALFSLLLDEQSVPSSGSPTSSFRPPPRVTMTEVKRKSWLADLANPDVPLRRLNRTIPQGIRGQTLLEQCLAHFIPISRAIWFAKCVGANEIRTLKRKGPGTNPASGSEHKWLREWTVGIEQFADSTLRQSDQSNWRGSVQYVLQLCTRLYQENLLEREHYLDWVVKSFATSGLNQTPFWLMVTHIYIRDLVRLRKRGKRVASALLDKLRLFEAHNKDSLRPLVERLRAQIHTSAISQPLCFLMPDQWPDVESTLQSCFSTDMEADSKVLAFLRKTNEQTMGCNRFAYTKVITPVERLLQILDSSCPPYHVATIAEQCLRAHGDFPSMLKTVLEWSVTRFRSSKRRLYLVVRLTGQWRQKGFDIETPLFDFFTTRSQLSTIRNGDLCHLFSELSRAQAFSLSRYLQWLNIRAGLLKRYPTPFNPGNEPQEAIPDAENRVAVSQMLTELCLNNSDAHIVNLRNNLLSRTGFDPQVEARVCQMILSYLKAVIPEMAEIPGDIGSINSSNPPTLKGLPWSIRSQVAQRLRKFVQNFCANSLQIMKRQGLKDAAHPIDVKHFCTVRDIFEQMEDFSMLADALAAFTSIPREDILPACVDTLNRHAEIFSAIGAFEPLHEKLSQAYVDMRSVKPSVPLFALSLIDIQKRHKSKIASMHMLKTDLLKGDRGAAVAACSPFSDGVAESLQQAGASFLEDFEAILRSEVNMNEETMIQLFGVLIDRITKLYSSTEHSDTGFALCELLARLRLHRGSDSDRLIKEWLLKAVIGNNLNEASLLADLVCTNATDYDTIMQVIQDLLDNQTADLDRLARTARTLLSFSEDVGSCSNRSYRVALHREQWAFKHPLRFLDIVSKTDTILGFEPGFNEVLQPILCIVVLGWPPASGNILASLRDRLVEYLGEAFSKTGGSDNETLAWVCESANEFTKPFCRMIMEAICQGKSQQELTRVSESLFATMTSMSSRLEKFDWSSLLPKNNDILTRQIREKALEGLFSALPSFVQAKGNYIPLISPERNYDTAAMFLHFAVAVSQNLEGVPSSTISSHLIEKTTALFRSLGSTPSAANPTSAPSTPLAPMSMPTPSSSYMTAVPTSHNDNIALALKYLPFLLQVACLQRSQFTSTTMSKPVQQEHIKLLIVLLSIALHPALQTALESHSTGATSTEEHHDLISYTYNVATTLVDDLPDDAKMICLRFFKDKTKDPRVQFLLGGLNTLGSAIGRDLGSGLQVIKEGKGVVGEWKPKQWEVLEGAKEGESWVNLGVFGARSG